MWVLSRCVVSYWLCKSSCIQFTHKFQYKYYGVNISVSIEIIVLEHFSASRNTSPFSVQRSWTWYDVFHSFLYNDRKQDVTTTAAHRKNHLFVEELTNYFYNLSTIWENTYDCTENYIFSTALYLLSNFLQAYNKLLTVMSVHQDMPDRWLTASTQQKRFFFS